MFEQRKARKRVANGARWLDENFSGWEGRINPRTLDLSDGMTCICGQVFSENAVDYSNGYGWACKNLFSEAGEWITELVKIPPDGKDGIPLFGDELAKRLVLVSRMLGFEREGHITYGMLQVEWVKLLKTRVDRLQKPASAVAPQTENVVEVAEKILLEVK